MCLVQYLHEDCFAPHAPLAYIYIGFAKMFYSSTDACYGTAAVGGVSPDYFSLNNIWRALDLGQKQALMFSPIGVCSTCCPALTTVVPCVVVTGGALHPKNYAKSLDDPVHFSLFEICSI